MAGAPHGKSYMGWWGHMAQKYTVKYAVSSQAQKPFYGALHAAFFNTLRRVKAQAFYVIVPVSLYYYIWTEANKYNHWLYTKAGKETLDRLNAE